MRTTLAWILYVLYLLGVLVAWSILLVVLVSVSRAIWPESTLAGLCAALISLLVAAGAARAGYVGIVLKRRGVTLKSGPARPPRGRKRKPGRRGARRGLDEVYEASFGAAGGGELSGLRVEARVSFQDLPKGRRWRGAEPVLVGGIRIDRALVYVADGEREECPGTLCLGAPVARSGEVHDEDLNYWPCYADLSPQGRRGLLLWLADGARTTNVSISYVFLYFYGLEQRAVGDGQDLEAVRAEVLRLHALFGSNRSFHGYACALVGMTHALEGSDPSDSLARLAPRGHKKLPLPLLEALSTCWSDRTWPARYVLERLKHEASDTIVHKRTWPQFEELFLLRFGELHPDGLRPRKNARTEHVRYHWAANTGTVHREFASLGPASYGAGWKKALGLWSDVTAELKPYALAAGRKSLGESALYRHLPEELKSGEHPEQKSWQAWFEDHADDQERCLTTWGALAELSPSLDPKDGRFTPKRCLEAANLCDSIGLAMEPDPRAGRRTSRLLADRVLLYRPASGQAEPPGEYHDALSLMVEICVGVAEADGEVGEDEIERILDHIDRENSLGDAERERLLASVAYFHATGGGLARATRARLGKLPEAVRDSLARLTVLVALADDVVTAAEEKALRRVHRALGFPRSELDAVLHPQGTTGDAPAAADAEAPVAIDWDRVRAITADTREVQSLLHRALASAEEEQPPAPEPARVEPAADPALDELDERLRALVAWARGRASDVLPAGDWDEQCKARGLMAAMAIERINDWADEALGDHLIEGDGPYTVHLELLGRAGPADRSEP